MDLHKSNPPCGDVPNFYAAERTPLVALSAHSTHNHPVYFWEVHITCGYRLVATAYGQTQKEAEDTAAQIIQSCSVVDDLRLALKSVVSEMRREHDAGDGHFSTDQVEAAERAVAKAEGRDA